jgi:hypothetical protein
MACPACGTTVAATDQFCPKCFARLEPPNLWRRLLSWFRLHVWVEVPGIQSRPQVTIKKTVDIRTTDKDGVKHEYHSLNEVPPEIRAKIERLEADALSEKGGSTFVTDTSSAGRTTASGTFITKKISVYRIKDASGNEHIYHSLEELPPEIRAAIEAAQGNKD